MAPRKSTGKRSTKRKKSASNKNTQDNQIFLKKEILILVSFAICALLFISNFGVGGSIGNTLSEWLFYLFGLIAYIAPLLIFIGIAFVTSNIGNRFAYLKAGAGVVFSCMICTIFELVIDGYDKNAEFQVHTNAGGWIGGIFTKMLCSAIGIIGTYLVVIVICIICLVIITEKSFVDGMKKQGSKAYITAKEDVKRHREQAEIHREQRRQENGAEKRKDRVVSGVSFDTTIAKKTPDMQELIPSNGKEPLRAQDKLFTTEDDTGQLVLSRAQPLTADNSDDSVEESAKTERSLAKPRTAESKKQVDEATADVDTEIKKNEEKQKKAYHFPPLKLLQRGKNAGGDSDEYLRQTASKLQQTLQNFGVNVTVTNVSCGPSVTRYELQPEQGVKVSKIVALQNDIKLNLAASDIRIEAPIPGKAAVGIEVPNKENVVVMLRDLLETDDFKYHGSKVAFAAGRDISGKVVVADIAKMPHVLIAGATGSGKSVCINTLIVSILYKATPDEVKLIMIDPKVVELSVYNGIPHLMIPVVTDPKKAAGALNWAVTEMTKRYQLFAEYNVRDIKGYNAKVESVSDMEDDNKPQKLPQIVIIVDELADLMMVAPGEVEDAICRLAQLARAAGIHLVLATQRPSVNVITGLIKANMPSRIAFAVSSGVDSRTIIDMNGAEKLLGKGDMLFYPTGYPKPVRVQGSFVSDKEVQSVVEYLVNNGGGVTYNEEITRHMNSIENGAGTGGASGGNAADDRDVYFVDAGKFVIEKDKASIGMLQRVFKIGFNRAARIMDQLAEAGVVGEEEGTKPRKVLMSMEQFENYIEEYL